MGQSKSDPLNELVEEFNQQQRRDDGAQVARSLCAGLGVLSDLLYVRLRADVEREFGADSMLIPVSELKTQRASKEAIKLFQVAESAWAAAQHHYVDSEDWYVGWLGRLRLGEEFRNEEHAEQLARYRSQTPDERRLALIDVLLEVLPESRRAPLVLFRLVPLAVHLATAMAFGDRTTACELRERQAAWLPAIRDCHRCHGAVIENGELCEMCGNPVWHYQWLTVAD